MSLKLSIIKNHVQSTKHAASKKKVASSNSREQDISVALSAYEKEVHPTGETLPEAQKVYRVKVVTTFLKAGVPLSKIEHFRGLLEENAYRLSDRHGMSDLVPFILGEEKQTLKGEIQGKRVSVIFDGTTRLGEAFVVVLRFVDSFVIKQRLVCFRTLAKSMTGEEIARELISVLSAGYGITSDRVIAAMRDRASANGAAMRTMKVVFPQLLDVGCFAHTIDLVGGKFQTPNLESFIHLWISLFAHSPRVRLWWKQLTGKAMSLFCPTRWWSRWEVMNQVMVYFGDLVPFLQSNPELSPATRRKLLDMLNDPNVNAHIRIKLAAIIDAGAPFVKATYKLEGDGALALYCFEILNTIVSSIQVAHYPNVHAIATILSGGSHAGVQHWLDYAKMCVKPGLQYFLDKFSEDLKECVGAFKAARLCLPHKVAEYNPTADTVDLLMAFPFLNKPSILQGLKAELPAYLAKADGISSETDPVEWWKGHSADLPNWSSATADILLVQPSSAAAERVFSLLKASFGSQQDTTLNDYIECSLMLQYNNR